jgi:hypothetical protein
MGQAFFYCSDLSRQRDEPRYGTASAGDVWLLLEYPSWWSKNAFADSALPSEAKEHIRALLTRIPRSRLLLIKQGSVRRPQLKLFVARTRERNPFIVEFDFARYEELLNLDIEAAAAGRTPAGASTLTAPLYLVCTHGRRDKCCAKFGYALYKHMRTRGVTSVWQSSHVGGDRFAANLICFPHGLFYAHVNEHDERGIVEAYGERRIVLANYRGRACYPQFVQAAEYFVRAESGRTKLNELRLLKRERLAEHKWRVQFAARDAERVYEVTLSSHVSEFHQFLTCSALAEKSVAQFNLDDYRVLNDRAAAPV